MVNDIKKTLEDRGSLYGKFTDNAEVCQKLLEVIEKAPSYSKLSRLHKESYHMIFHKIARSVCGDPNHIDNIHDIIGFAKLLEDFLMGKGDRGNQ